MRNPKVSVVIPTYNRPNLLRRALESVFMQSYENFEVVIVDDSQTSETFGVVKEFNSEKIKYSRRHERCGVSSAKNKGIENATGELIAFLGDDDEWLPNKLMRQVNIFENCDSEIGVIHSNCFIMNDDKKIPYHKNILVDQSLDTLLKIDFVADSTALVKKECFERVGYFDERMPFAEDYDFYIRAAKEFKFKYIHDLLAIHHINKQKEKLLSKDSMKIIKGYQMIIVKHWKEYRKRKRSLAKYLHLIGSELQDIGDAEQGKKYLVEAFRDYYLDITPILSILINSSSFRRIKQTLSTSFINKMLTFIQIYIEL